MKTAYELSHVKSVKAVALLIDGEEAGKIVANYSDNPPGTVCTVTYTIYRGSLHDNDKKHTFKAGGYGYDKFGACNAQFLNQFRDKRSSQSDLSDFEAFGYSFIQVL